MAVYQGGASHMSVESIPTPTSGSPKSFDFDLNGAVDSFNFYLFAAKKDEPLAVKLESPDAKYVPQKADEDLYGGGIGSKGFVSEKGKLAFTCPIPASASQPHLPGTWNGVIKYDQGFGVPEMKVCQRISLPQAVNRLSLKVNLVLYARNTNLARKKRWIQDELKVVNRIFQNAGINCDFSSLQVKPLPSATITDNFWSTATKNLVLANAQDDALTVLFVEDLDVAFAEEAGKAGGIPGPQGFVNRFAAVLVKITDDPHDLLAVNTNFLGFTIAHEMGHYLGLTHESANNENRNLMYPRMGGLSDGSLNATQHGILRNQPLVTENYLAAPKTPITSLEVTIKTGTRWPSWVDGPGTDMDVQFALGSDDTGYQSWYLDAWGNNFEAGSTDVFTLSDIHNLYMEDVNTWKIFCSWSNDMYVPVIGGRDDWNFKHIKVVANGQTLVDTTVDAILSYSRGNNYFIRKFR